MSDIRKHAVAPTSRLHLRSADDELLYADAEDGTPDISKPMVANLYGPGSKQYAKAQTKQNNRMVDRLKKKGRSDQKPEEATAEKAEFLADCTQSLENVTYEALSGDALHKAVYADLELGFIAEQVGKHLGEWSNFLKASPTN